MINAFDPWAPMDPLAAFQKEACGTLVIQPMPERGGSLRLGTGCGCGCADGETPTGPENYGPPEDGENGVRDSYLCK